MSRCFFTKVYSPSGTASSSKPTHKSCDFPDSPAHKNNIQSVSRVKKDGVVHPRTKKQWKSCLFSFVIISGKYEKV